MKQGAEAELSTKLESKTKGMEKIVMESERLRREIKRVISEEENSSIKTDLLTTRYDNIYFNVPVRKCVTSDSCYSLLGCSYLFGQEKEATERLRVTKSGLEVSNEKLEAELEETKRKLHAALSRAIPEGADSKTWKASVVTRSAGVPVLV